jgi:Abnormal spindle-like microcephaly-assoc'd, ASPM-SPD-2-Hydin
MRRISLLLIALACGFVAAVALAQPKDSRADTHAAPVFSAVNPITFDFVGVGTTSGTRTATVTNAGAATLKFSAVTLTGRDVKDFRIVADGCTGVSVAPGTTCSVGVRFAPTTAGTRVANLRFTDNTPCHDWINLAGSGTETVASVRAQTATCESTVENTTTVTSTTTLPGTTTTTTNTVGPVSASSVVGLPTTCSSRRTVVVRLTAPAGTTFTAVKVMLHGKTLKTLRGKAIRTKVSLRGLPRGRFTLQVRATTSKGTSFVRKHFYVTCVANKD